MTKRFFVPFVSLSLMGSALIVLLGAAIAFPAQVASSQPSPSFSHRAYFQAGMTTLPPSDVVTGNVASKTSLRADVMMAMPNEEALTSFVQSVSTPHSPNYRQYLGKGAFAAKFGPTTSSLAAVRTWLSHSGFSLGPTTPDGLLIPIFGTESTFQAAFASPVDSVRLASGRVARAQIQALSAPSSVASLISGVVGINDLSKTTPNITNAPKGAKALAATSSKACSEAHQIAGSYKGTYTDTQLSALYGMTTLYKEGRTGLGVTIGVYELESHFSSDVNAFEHCYGLSNTIENITVTHGPFGKGPGSGEAALDIETLAAMAPGSQILVYQGPNNTSSGPINTMDKMATDDRASVISTSWGQCETMNTRAHGGTAHKEAVIFAEMAAQGQTVLAASGDTGSEGCYQKGDGTRTTQLAVEDPASQPAVTAVGGTEIPHATLSQETTWNGCLTSTSTHCATDLTGASGGGLSKVWAMPSWQSSSGNGVINSFSTTGECSTGVKNDCRRREVPDVSADASPLTGVLVYWDNSWLPVGGTSAAAPQWAAMMALVNQGCSSKGAGLVGMANPKLYTLGTNDPSVFHEVTGGNNDLTHSHAGDYPATPGYNLATGWGSPNAGALLEAMQPSGGCPVLSSISSAKGPVTGGSVLSITGSDLSGATSVLFGSKSQPVLSDVQTTVSVKVPDMGYTDLADVQVRTPNGTSGPNPTIRYEFGSPQTGRGLWVVSKDGNVEDIGNAPPHGSISQHHAGAPIASVVSLTDGLGYYEVAQNGHVYAFGKARNFGSVSKRRLAAPIVSMALAAGDKGYYEMASNGGVFAFGNAKFYGSKIQKHAAAPMVGIDVVPGGGGYWLVAANGGIFCFGPQAHFYGSAGSKHLTAPVISMVVLPTKSGYVEATSTGGIYTFGKAKFYGALGRLSAYIGAIALSPDAKGYWLIGTTGSLYPFGDAPNFGSVRATSPIVAMAET